MTDIALLQAVPSRPDHALMCLALAHVLDVPTACAALLDAADNLDLLWLPSACEQAHAPVNYFQMLHLHTDEREPLLSLFSYLYESRDPYYHERYDMDAHEHALRDAYHAHVRSRYASAKAFLDALHARAWLPCPAQHDAHWLHAVHRACFRVPVITAACAE